MTTRDPEDDPREVGAAILAASATVRAPGGLRIALAAAQPSRSPRRRGAFAGAAAALAGAALVIVLAMSGGGASAPSVADAAVLALRAPTQAPPRGSDGRLSLSSGGVRFPDYGPDSGWRPVGARHDKIAGRAAVSVAYVRGGARAGYTIVAGAPLALPAGARHTTYEGLRVAVVTRGGLRIVTWRRGGRTCVVAARGTALQPLLELAART